MTDVERAHVAEPNEWWHAFLDSIDEVQTADVKPTPESDWTTARIVRDKFGDLWRRDGYAWRIFAGHSNGSVSPLSALSSEGPITIVIDADGNNVEALDLAFELDQVRAMVRRLSSQLAEAVRARETALRDLRKLGQEDTVLRRQIADLYRAVTRLEAENARLQAQLGDGR